MTDNLHEKMSALFNPIVTGLGFELWGLELFRQGAHTLLRVYVEKTGGITLDDCQRVSEQLGALLDVEDPIKQRYLLEVSSPGLNRVLFTKEQFEKYLESEIKVRLKMAYNGRRNYAGKLIRVLLEEIVVLVDGEEVILPMVAIEKANLITIN